MGTCSPLLCPSVKTKTEVNSTDFITAGKMSCFLSVLHIIAPCLLSKGLHTLRTHFLTYIKTMKAFMCGPPFHFCLMHMEKDTHAVHIPTKVHIISLIRR